MNQTVQEFLEDIKLEFCWLLYIREYEVKNTFMNETYTRIDRATFPYCCGLASQIIASFLTAKFEQAKCYMTIGMPFNHSWCECQNEIIDYTFFQFNLSSESATKFKNYTMEREEFEEIVKNQGVIHERKTHTAGQDWIDRKELELLGVEKAKKYSFSKEGFLQYADNVFEDVQLQMHYQ